LHGSPVTSHHTHTQADIEACYVKTFVGLSDPRPVDISYTGLEADVAILADRKQTSDF